MGNGTVVIRDTYSKVHVCYLFNVSSFAQRYWCPEHQAEGGICSAIKSPPRPMMITLALLDVLITPSQSSRAIVQAPYIPSWP